MRLITYALLAGAALSLVSGSARATEDCPIELAQYVNEGSRLEEMWSTLTFEEVDDMLIAKLEITQNATTFGISGPLQYPSAGAPTLPAPKLGTVTFYAAEKIEEEPGFQVWYPSRGVNAPEIIIVSPLRTSYRKAIGGKGTPLRDFFSYSGCRPK